MTTSPSDRWTQVALAVAMFLVGLLITFIVIKVQRDSTVGDTHIYKQQRANVVVNGYELPVAFLGQVRGDAAMTQDEFAMVVGRALATHARETSTEACASICRADNGAWGVAPLTVGGHIICPVTAHCPEGMEPTSVSIHSHPLEKGRNFIVNDADAALGGRKGRLLKAGDPEQFSKEDIQGKGYVVTYLGVLLFQERRGQVRRIGSVD